MTAAIYPEGAAGHDPQDVDAALALAVAAERPSDRFVAAHHAALQVAAAVLAARRPRVRGRENVWRVLARAEPVLGEWAAWFEGLQLTCRAVEAGVVAVVNDRLADDLVRDAHAFRDAAGLVLMRKVPGHG